jgi:hypothetical protein
MIAIRDVANSPFLDTSRWPSFCAVTLTLKQGRQSDQGIWMHADEHQTKKAFQVFMNKLNKAIFKSAAVRFGKKLAVIPVVEKEAYGRWHLHAAIESPARFTSTEFEQLIRSCWSAVDWSRERINFQPNADRGWIEYMLKWRQKSDLETWLDCIIWESFQQFVDA